MRRFVGLLMLMLPTVSYAEENSSAGEKEFFTRCAMCHGLNGKGQGPLTKFMSIEAPDLTSLTSRNKGKFPFDDVFRIIDGRKIVGAHGSREMPVWGNEYNAEAESNYQDDYVGSARGEIYVAGRILLLIKHLESFQEQ